MRAWIMGLTLMGWSLAQAENSLELGVYAVPSGEFQKTTALARPFMSPEGNLIEDRSRGRLLIEDRPEVHRRLRAVLNPWALPPRNIRIRVSSVSPQRIYLNGIRTSGGGFSNGTNASVFVRKGNKIQVHAQTTEIQTGLTQQPEFLVVSGGKASISVADEVPEPTWFEQWGQPYGLWPSGIHWKEIGAKMVVEPVALPDNTIRVRLIPSFSYIVDRQSFTVEVQRLSTEVVVADGAEVDVGMIPMADQEFLKRFLSAYDQFGNQRQVRLKLRASIEDAPVRPE